MIAAARRELALAQAAKARGNQRPGPPKVSMDMDIDSDDDNDVDSETDTKDDLGKDEKLLLGTRKKEEDDDDDSDNEGVSGWADSMARILGSNKPKNKKTLILSRAKLDHEIAIPKDKEIKRKVVPRKNEIEVVSTTEGESPKKPKLEGTEKELSAKQSRRLELLSVKERKVWENINRIKPTRSDPRDKEIELLKIATKGVVQLFNAVNSQQKTTKSKLKDVSTSEFKKDKVLKKTKEIFEDALEKSSKLVIDKIPNAAGSNGNVVDGEIIEIKDEEDEDNEETRVKLSGANTNANEAVGPSRTTRSSSSNSKKPTWRALHDDFMLDAKLKDWDKSSSDSDE